MALLLVYSQPRCVFFSRCEQIESTKSSPTQMAAPGTSDSFGISTMSKQAAFESPANSAGGSRFDMGMLALFLVSNWFVNGETVLIDGGVS